MLSRKNSSSASLHRDRNGGGGSGRTDSPSRKNSSNEQLSISQRTMAEHNKLSPEELKRATIHTADRLYRIKQHQQVNGTPLKSLARPPPSHHRFSRSSMLY